MQTDRLRGKQVQNLCGPATVTEESDLRSLEFPGRPDQPDYDPGARRPAQNRQGVHGAWTILAKKPVTEQTGCNALCAAARYFYGVFMDSLEKKIKSKRIRNIIIAVLVIAAVIAGIFSLKIEKKPDAASKTKTTTAVSTSAEKVESIETSLTADKTAAATGSKVELKVTVKGGKAPYKYHFLVYDQQGNEWYKLTDFQEKDSYEWTAGKPGIKTLFADVKDSSGQTIRAQLSVTITETEAEAEQAELEQKAAAEQKNEEQGGANAQPYADVNAPGISASPGSAIEVSGPGQPTTGQQATTSARNVTIKIICTELTSHPEMIPDNLKNYVPSNGIILNTKTYQAGAGTTVYDVLNRACRENGIQMEHSDHPIYGTYVKAINYLYEKAAGNESGWKYKVNGKVPNVGCGSYQVSSGDEIIWYYTVNANG